jgi:hypothetical protein
MTSSPHSHLPTLPRSSTLRLALSSNTPLHGITLLPPIQAQYNCIQCLARPSHSSSKESQIYTFSILTARALLQTLSAVRRNTFLSQYLLALLTHHLIAFYSKSHFQDNVSRFFSR